MSDDIRLNRPDELVRVSKNTLRDKLPLVPVVEALKNAGQMLHVATNASAKNADIHNKIQDNLFDLVKICDGFLLVLTSFKMGAKDIVEALGIAYLYLVDGFPDMAFTKMDSLQTTMEGMRKRVARVSELLSQTKLKLQRVITSRPQKQMTRDLKLCLQTSVEAKKQLDLVEDYCRDLGPEVDQWLRECREVAQPQMVQNRRDAERLSLEDQKKYWKGLMNQPDVKRYLERWRALSLLCEEYQPTLKRIRNTIDSYYTDNPMPNEAIRKAWKDAEKLPIEVRSWKALLAGQDLPVPVEPEIHVFDGPVEPNTLDIRVDRETPNPVEQNVESDRHSGGSASPRKGEDNPAEKQSIEAISLFIDTCKSFKLRKIKARGIIRIRKKNPHNKRIHTLEKKVGSLLPGKLPMGKHDQDFVKKLDKIVRYMANALQKLERDLGSEPKYKIVNEDKEIMEHMRETLSNAMKVVKDWKDRTETCTKLLA